MTTWTVVKVLLLWALWFAGLLGAFHVVSDVWVALGGIDFLAVCIAALILAFLALCWLSLYSLRELAQ